ncbi:hypothetical protein Vadar_015135 [Vaccinium darrowii]|uniref:Uncharacterized protein n=1 Tax=Vaccinium darrowii TaxID=229202 RepID=A0ACB7XA48_9ERIC|nr:hypothetical protein Vadar_015135 [Vaccinium darrowii]
MAARAAATGRRNGNNHDYGNGNNPPPPPNHDEAKARKFEWGLDPDIRVNVIGFEYQTFAQVVNATLIHERALLDSRKILNQRRAPQSQGGPVRNNRNYAAQKPYSIRPQYQARGYQGQNQNYDRRCYNCGQDGHLQASCPQATGMGYHNQSGYQQQGQSGGQQQQQRAQPPPQQKFTGNQYQGKNQQPSRPPVRNPGNARGPNHNQPAAGGRIFALQEEGGYDPSVIQVRRK